MTNKEKAKIYLQLINSEGRIQSADVPINNQLPTWLDITLYKR